MHLLHLVGILFPHFKDDARSKSHQTLRELPQILCRRIWQNVYKENIVFWKFSLTALFSQLLLR